MGARLAPLLAAFFLLGAAPPALALTFEVDKSGQWLRLSGGVEASDVKDFRSILDRDGARAHTVYLDSGGGNLYAGLLIGETIRTRNLATRVAADAECASACVYILAGGRIREVEQGGKVGVHMASQMFDDDYIEKIKSVLRNEKGDIDTRVRVIVSITEQSAARAAAFQATYLTRMGVSLRLLRPNFDTHHLDIYWLSAKELVDYNLVNAR